MNTTNSPQMEGRKGWVIKYLIHFFESFINILFTLISHKNSLC